MTNKELAKITGVSPATVSIVLNNKGGVGEETRARVLQAAKENGYSINKSNRKKMKGVLLLKYWGSGMIVEENQSFVSTIIDAISSELFLHNHRLTMHIVKDSLREALKEIDFDSFCSAIVVATEITRELYEVLDQIPIPYVMVDNAVFGVNCNSVSIDNSSNVYIALAYLKENGHKQIGYLRSSTMIENFAERSEAFSKWTKVLGFDFVEQAQFFLTPTLEGAYKDMCIELKSGMALPTCLYADNDTIAIGAIKALKEHGYRVPGDVSVIAMDDIPFASVNSPALTTVRVQKEMIGQIAVSQLFTLLNNPAYGNVKTRISGTLIVRSSVLNLLNQG
ncbi:MAG: LacI family DNA-binding transcriptional regulator [Oscillospiraceae bacterium]|nr:LacI family DNA-binding transcriptional regulator [Oscillospiraceae bacterium]